jgi:hypothetical protein
MFSLFGVQMYNGKFQALPNQNQSRDVRYFARLLACLRKSGDRCGRNKSTHSLTNHHSHSFGLSMGQLAPRLRRARHGAFPYVFSVPSFMHSFNQELLIPVPWLGKNSADR